MRKRLSIALTVIGILVSLSTPAAESPKTIAYYTAYAVNMVNGIRATVTIGIYRWSSDAEKIALTDVLKSEGNAQMVADMSQLPQVGFIMTQGTLAYALYYARENTLPDGTRQIVLATNRPMTFGAAVSGGTKNRYDLGVAELHFSKDGKGEGKVIGQGMAKIDKSTGKIEVENYMGQPTRLLDVKEEKQ